MYLFFGFAMVFWSGAMIDYPQGTLFRQLQSCRAHVGSFSSHKDSEPGQGEPTQSNRDCWGTIRANEGLLGAQAPLGRLLLGCC